MKDWWLLRTRGLRPRKPSGTELRNRADREHAAIIDSPPSIRRGGPQAIEDRGPRNGLAGRREIPMGRSPRRSLSFLRYWGRGKSADTAGVVGGRGSGIAAVHLDGSPPRECLTWGDHPGAVRHETRQGRPSPRSRRDRIADHDTPESARHEDRGETGISNHAIFAIRSTDDRYPHQPNRT
jgi:hypothetical protein